jgi:PTH1 family peptidyl-tRNA hydrolase
MKLIVGLGNPGLIYAGTRHNIGFRVLKYLAASLRISFKRDSSVFSLVGKAKSPQGNIILALPQTFMNLSGLAVKAMLKKFKVAPEDLLVVCDDMDLDLGRMKIRPSGSSAGQRGVKSIIEHLGTQDFNRLRIGIGRPITSEDAASYVLAGFLHKQRAAVKKIIEEASGCCMSWVKNGITTTMNIYNVSLATGEGEKSNE